MNIEEARQMLGLGPIYNKSEIRRAYLKMVKQYHPDLFKTYSEKARATRVFIKSKKAHDILTASVPDSTYPFTTEQYSSCTEHKWAKKDERVPYKKSSTWRSPLSWLFDIIPDSLSLLIVPLFIGFYPFSLLLLIFHSLLFKRGKLDIPDFETRGRAFWFMILSTVLAAGYLYVLQWAVISDLGETASTSLKIVARIVLSFGVVIFLFDQWISFILYWLLKRKIKAEMAKFALTILREP